MIKTVYTISKKSTLQTNNSVDLEVTPIFDGNIYETKEIAETYIKRYEGIVNNTLAKMLLVGKSVSNTPEFYTVEHVLVSQ